MRHYSLIFFLLGSFIMYAQPQQMVDGKSSFTDSELNYSLHKASVTSQILDSVVAYKFHSETDSFAFHKDEFSHNEQGLKTLQLIWRTPMMVPPLELDAKQEWEYYSTGQISSNTWAHWNSQDEDWYYGSRSEYNYKAVENGVWDTRLYWSNTENNWITRATYEYLIDAQGELLFSRIVGDTLFYNEIEFDAYRNHLSTHSWYFDTVPGENILVGKKVKTYDDNYNLISVIDTSISLPHDGEDLDTNYSKTVHEYDAQQNRILTLDYFGREGTWMPYHKEEFEYENGLRIKMSSRFYDEEIEDWSEASWDETYAYTEHGLISAQSDYVWDFDMRQHEILNRFYYYYSYFTPDFTPDENDEIAIRVFPNPARNSINVHTGSNSAVQFQLFSIQGQLLLSKKTQPGNSFRINVESFARGSYILRIETDQREYREKIVLY